LLAVTARPVELAKVINSESVDGDGASSILLDDLVLSSGSTSAND
jgi:hypothetical protein